VLSLPLHKDETKIMKKCKRRGRIGIEERATEIELRCVFVAGLSGDNFRFDRQGDGPARYNIIHFKQVSPGVFRWLRVGEYWEGELRLNMSGEQTKDRWVLGTL